MSKFFIYKKCVDLILEHKSLSFLLIIYGLLGSGARFIFIQLLNKFNVSQNQMFIYHQSILLIALLLLASVLSFWFTYKANLKGLDVLREMQITLVLKASDAIYRSQYSGINDRFDMLLFLRQDARAVRNISMNIIRMALKFGNFVAVYIALLLINWQIAVFVPVLIIPIMWHVTRINKEINKESINLREHILKNAGTTNKFLKSLPLMKLYDNINIGSSIVSRMLRERFFIRLYIARLKYLAVFFSGIAGSISIVAIMIITAYFSKDIDIQKIVPALVGFFMIQQSIGKIIESNARNNEYLPIAELFFGRFEKREDISESSNDKLKLDRIESVEFKQTRFFDDTQQITGWDMKIKKGEIYCLISRKLPIFDMIIRYMLRIDKVMDGQILINGMEVERYNRHSLYSAIGLLVYNSPVFPLSIKENIMLVNKNFSEQEFEEIRKKLRLDEVFADLKEGIDTDLRERNLQLNELQELTITACRLIVGRYSLFFVDMHVLRKLPEHIRTYLIEYLLAIKDKAIIIIKPSHISEFRYCDRIVFFKKYDLCINASIKDLQEGIQRDYFYINPHLKVCYLESFSTEPEKCASFERAVFGYSNFIKGLVELYNGEIFDGDMALSQKKTEDKVILDELEEEEEDFE